MRDAPRGHRDFTIAGIAGVACLVIVGNARGIGGRDFTSSSSVTVESLGPPTLIAGGSGAWVVYAPTLSIDCSPPRGCYAKTQRIHYDFSCAPRYAVVTERISMDLNGNIVKHELQDERATYALSNSRGATELLDTFCPLPGSE